jgi:hypothetical protein
VRLVSHWEIVTYIALAAVFFGVVSAQFKEGEPAPSVWTLLACSILWPLTLVAAVGYAIGRK